MLQSALAMRSGRWGRVFAVYLASSSFLAACGEEGPVGYAERESLAVELALSPDGIEIRKVEPVTRRRIARHRQALTTLEYRLVDSQGDLVVSARMPDFRWAHSEAIDPETGAMTRYDVRFLAGVGTLRLPAVAGELVVMEPRAGGAVELGRAAFDPDARATALVRPLDDDEVLGEPILIAGGGAKEGAVDVLLLPEAYKEDQLIAFHERATAIAVNFVEDTDFADYRDRINVWYLDVRSNEDQIDEGGWFSDHHDTAFDARWGGGGLLGLGDVPDECVTYGDGGEARDLGDAYDMDMVAMIANVDGVRGLFFDDMISMGWQDDGYTLAHELGHAILDLNDEYVEDLGHLEGFRCGLTSFLGLHESVNVRSTILDLGWWDLLTPGVELPTPPGGDGDTVGAYEGANHCESGWYRPQETCAMRISSAPMCKVCRRELDRLMDALAVDPPSCPEEWRNDGMCDLCLDHDPDCEVANVCDVDGVCLSHEHCSTCPEDCGDCPILGGCGDGGCAANESDSSCPMDCGCTASGQCTNGPAPYGCYCDPACSEAGDCCADVDVESCDPS